MLEASDPNNSCSRLCTCGLGQQLLWNCTGRLNRCLMVLDQIRMMSGSLNLAASSSPPTWSHHFKSLGKWLDLFFFLRVLQELMGLPGVSKVGWSSWGFAGDPELVPW